jgi:alanine-synthesizing transaminase
MRMVPPNRRVVGDGATSPRTTLSRGPIPNDWAEGATGSIAIAHAARHAHARRDVMEPPPGVSAPPTTAFSRALRYDTRMPAGTSVPVSARVSGFSYAIRNIVAEARSVERTGQRVRYLNIGDPVQFGFKTPPHLIEAVERAMRDGHNGYVSSVGIEPARRAVADEYTARGVAVGPDRVVLTAGTSEGIELALSALVDAGDDVLVPTPTYPLYTAVLAKIGARAVFYRADPDNGWQPDLDHLARLISPATRALVVIDPNNPTGAVYPESTRRALIALAERAGVPILADEVYSDVAFDGPTALLGSLAPEAAIISFSSLSKAYLAPGWRTGWIVIGGSDRLDDVLTAIRKMADGRLCSPGPMQYAVAPALTGDRSHQRQFADALRVRATLTTERISAIPGMRCVMPRAAFYAMPQVELPAGRTDEDYVLGLLRATGNLCVYGSGFGMPADQGFFRVVFLAAPDVLSAIYDDMARFTREFLAS